MAIFGFQALGNILVTAVVTWTLNRRSSIAVKLLRGLTSYRLTPAPVEAAKADKSHKHALPRLTKQQTAKARRQEAESGDADSEAVSAVTISPRQIESTPFFQYLDTMVAMLPVAVANFALGKLHQMFLLPPNFFPALFASLAVFLAMRALCAVNILSKLTPDTDKLFAACAALVSGIAAATVFGQAPKSLFALNTSAAAKALSQATGALLRSKAAAEEAKHMEDPVFSPMILELGLGLLAMTLGGLLLTPMTRIVCSYMAAVDTPDWARKQIGISAGTRMLLTTNLLLPGLVALLWVTPLFQEVLEIDTEWMPLIKTAAVTVLAVVQLLSTRPLVQSFLDSGFRQLHRLKQGTGPDKKSSDRIKAQADLVHILFVKVAIQCAAPAVILLGCAVVMMQPTQHGMLVTGQNIASVEMLQIPMGFWQCIADFCAWWTCICCFAFTAGFFALFRTKLLSSI